MAIDLSQPHPLIDHVGSRVTGANDEKVLDAPEVQILKEYDQALNAARIEHEDRIVALESAPPMQFARPEITHTSPLLVAHRSASERWVFAWKRSRTAQQYVLMSMLRDQAGVTDSEGGAQEMWRLGQVTDIGILYLMLKGSPTVTGAWTTQNASGTFHGPNTAAGPAPGTVVPYWRTTTAEDHLEWTGIAGPVISVGLMSSGTGALAEVLIDGVSVGAVPTNDGVGGKIITARFAVSSATHTVRVRHAGTTNQYLYVFGVNFYELRDAPPGIAADLLWYGRNNATNPNYIVNEGAQEYAFRNEDTGTWAGNYHGGETAVSPDVWRLDGEAVVLAEHEMRVARTVAIEQHTSIAWAGAPSQTMTARTRTRFHDGGLSFEASMSSSGTKLRTGMTVMCKTVPSFSRVLVPFAIDTTNTSDPRYVGGYFRLGRVNMVVQQEPATGRTLTTWWTLFPWEASEHGGAAIWKVDAAYHKVYYGPAIGMTRTMSEIAWEATWRFE